MMKPETPRRDADKTKWSATFFVAAELCRRGWTVGLTHGNTKTTDILAARRERKVSIDVKGIRLPGHWFGSGLLGERRKVRDHYIIFVAIPEAEVEKPTPRYYIVPGREAVELVEFNRDHKGPRSRKGHPAITEFPRRDNPQSKYLNSLIRSGYEYAGRWDRLESES